MLDSADVMQMQLRAKNTWLRHLPISLCMTVQQALSSKSDSAVQVSHSVQALPPELGSLQRLKAINATSNRLQTVPPAILQDCSSLQTLLLHANPISAEVRLSACSLVLAYIRCRHVNP